MQLQLVKRSLTSFLDDWLLTVIKSHPRFFTCAHTGICQSDGLNLLSIGAGRKFTPPNLLLEWVKITQSCLTLCNSKDYTVHGILQARILEWVRLSLLREIFPTQGSNPGLAHCRWILYQLSQQGNPRVLKWVACSFSSGSVVSGSSWPRNQTRVSCIADRFLTSWATKEALQIYKEMPYNYY